MEYPAEHAFRLLKACFDKAGLDMTFGNCKALSDRIAAQHPDGHTVSDDFLYRGLFRKLGSPPFGDRAIVVRYRDRIELMARYLGYPDYEAFVREIDNPPPPQLQGCVGTWYYYTREATGLQVLLRSPVVIWPEDGIFYMELQGKVRTFQGEVQFRQGGLFATITAHSNEKQLHLVFKVGMAVDPTLLQGVFSGYSSSLHPVAGRALLWRQPPERPYRELSIGRLDLNATPSPPEAEWPSRIVRHLTPYTDNYIRVVNDRGFDLDSL